MPRGTVRSPLRAQYRSAPRRPQHALQTAWDGATGRCRPKHREASHRPGTGAVTGARSCPSPPRTRKTLVRPPRTSPEPLREGRGATGCWRSSAHRPEPSAPSSATSVRSAPIRQASMKRVPARSARARSAPVRSTRMRSVLAGWRVRRRSWSRASARPASCCSRSPALFDLVLDVAPDGVVEGLVDVAAVDPRDFVELSVGEADEDLAGVVGAVVGGPPTCRPWP